MGPTFRAACGLAVLAALVAGCRQDPSSLPRHTIVYGGDVFTARRLNLALFDPTARDEILGGIAPVLREADLAMLNLEGVITTGGYYNELGNSSYMFRAHPFLVDELVEAGVDLVTMGNNHNPDYGPPAMVETIDRLSKAGIGYAGAGLDRRDAAQPVYRRIGDTVVAIVGIELTYAERYEATDARAGVFYVREAFLEKQWDREIVQELRRVAVEARRHAHVVLLSPHWDAHETPPAVTAAMRELAADLIDAGYDGILGHGRHETLGVEVFDGRPVIYDAGSVVIDYGSGAEDSRGMLWRVEISRAGVHAIEGVPIHMELNRTALSEGSERDRILERAEKLSRDLGTTLRIEGGRARLELDPGAVAGPDGAPPPPSRPAPKTIRQAPSDILHERLPVKATPIDVRWEQGIRLVGYELLAPALRALKSSQQTVVLYWQADTVPTDNYLVHLEARPVRDGVVQKGSRGANHLPGDWMLPTERWPVGKVVQDATNVRLLFEPLGEVAFFAGLRRLGRWSPSNHEGELLSPTKSDVDLVDGRLVPLGRTPYSDKAPPMRGVYYDWLKTRVVELSPVQPWGAPPMRW
jgi:poly-gamma-glutamate capsule biosynthesis protein CapA/YwtB (metallophosphatase superfamily)